MPQTEVPIERRFHGSVNLVILHLRRVAQSNDIDAGLAAARRLRMFDADNEAFVRRMLALDEALQSGGSSRAHHARTRPTSFRPVPCASTLPTQRKAALAGLPHAVPGSTFVLPSQAQEILLLDGT